MADPNNIQADQEYRTAIAERGKFFPVDEDYLTSIGYPTSGEGKYATLTYSINGGETLSAIDVNTTYQDTVLNSQITLGVLPTQITNLPNKGYVKLRVSAGGSCYLGSLSVSVSTGYLLDDDYPVESLTFESLSDVYVIGSGTLYVIGGYIA